VIRLLQSNAAVLFLPSPISNLWEGPLESGNYYDSTSRRFTFSETDNLEVARRMKRAGTPMGIGTRTSQLSPAARMRPYRI